MITRKRFRIIIPCGRQKQENICSIYILNDAILIPQMLKYSMT